jgi:hypothetical protein
MEKELLRCKPVKIRVLDEATSFGTEVILRGVRESTIMMVETKRDLTAFHALLTHTNGHLRYVDEQALGTSNHHLLDVVVFLQTLLGILP